MMACDGEKETQRFYQIFNKEENGGSNYFLCKNIGNSEA